MGCVVTPRSHIIRRDLELRVARRLACMPGVEVVVYEQPRGATKSEEKIESVVYRRIATRSIDRFIARVMRRIGKLRRPDWGYFATRCSIETTPRAWPATSAPADVTWCMFTTSSSS